MILIVEDDPQVARLISLVLERSGLESEIISDGLKALDRAKSLMPKIIFADLTIRGMGGEALCAAIKRDEKTRHTPFVVISGDRDIERKARVCGADDHLGKPFEFDDLLRIVRKHAAS